MIHLDSDIHASPSVDEIVLCLRSAHAAIQWALRNVPHQMNEFFTEWNNQDDADLWSEKMKQWAVYARSQ